MIVLMKAVLKKGKNFERQGTGWVASMAMTEKHTRKDDREDLKGKQML